MAYSEKVMEHFANPHNVGEMKDADGVGEVGNPKCGDIMRMYIKVEDDVITDVKFMTFGCGAAIATSSMATDLVKPLWKRWTGCPRSRSTAPCLPSRPSRRLSPITTAAAASTPLPLSAKFRNVKKAIATCNPLKTK